MQSMKYCKLVGKSICSELVSAVMGLVGTGAGMAWSRGKLESRLNNTSVVARDWKTRAVSAVLITDSIQQGTIVTKEKSLLSGFQFSDGIEVS
jgi:hypothetical protein